MAASERISLYTGDEAVRVSRDLDLRQLAAHDPQWEFMLDNGALEVGFEGDDLALLVHSDGSWAIIESTWQHDEFALFVLGAVATQPHTLHEGLRFIEELALRAGCKYICFGSYRRGWERLAATLGFSRDGDDGYYEKRLYE